MPSLLRSVALVAVLTAIASPTTPQITSQGGGSGQATSRRDTARYEVELRFTGYTGLAQSKPCDGMANLAGFDVLTGTVGGTERSQPDPDEEDVEYQGFLQRTTKIDFCNTRGNRSPTDDEVVWCIAALTGSAQMDVTITVSGSADQGAYVKARRTARMAVSTVQGNCETADMLQIKQDYPGGDDGGGASPNGQPITDAFSELLPPAPGSGPKFVVGGVAQLRVGTYKPDPKQGGWLLKVIRKLP